MATLAGAGSSADDPGAGGGRGGARKMASGDMRRWTWHPEAQLEANDLRKQDIWTGIALMRTIERLMILQRQGELTGPVNGRLERWCPGRSRQFISFVDGTCWVVYFVERRDGRGLGGLLFHEGAERGPAPNGACELAQHRMSVMPGW